MEGLNIKWHDCNVKIYLMFSHLLRSLIINLSILQMVYGIPNETNILMTNDW